MVKLLGKLIALILITLAKSSVINDELCDRQLSYFDDALDSRQGWALFGRYLALIMKSSTEENL